MTQIGQLSTLQELQTVVIILQIVRNGKGMIQMMAPDSNGNLQKIRWTTSGDDELFNCSLYTVTDAIIPMMRIVTGFTFQRTKTDDGITTFVRIDTLGQTQTKAG